MRAGSRLGMRAGGATTALTPPRPAPRMARPRARADAARGGQDWVDRLDGVASVLAVRDCEHEAAARGVRRRCRLAWPAMVSRRRRLRRPTCDIESTSSTHAHGGRECTRRGAQSAHMHARAVGWEAHAGGTVCE